MGTTGEYGVGPGFARLVIGLDSDLLALAQKQRQSDVLGLHELRTVRSDRELLGRGVDESIEERVNDVVLPDVHWCVLSVCAFIVGGGRNALGYGRGVHAGAALRFACQPCDLSRFAWLHYSSDATFAWFSVSVREDWVQNLRRNSKRAEFAHGYSDGGDGGGQCTVYSVRCQCTVFAPCVRTGRATGPLPYRPPGGMDRNQYVHSGIKR